MKNPKRIYFDRAAARDIVVTIKERFRDGYMVTDEHGQTFGPVAADRLKETEEA